MNSLQGGIPALFSLNDPISLQGGIHDPVFAANKFFSKGNISENNYFSLYSLSTPQVFEQSLFLFVFLSRQYCCIYRRAERGFLKMTGHTCVHDVCAQYAVAASSDHNIVRFVRSQFAAGAIDIKEKGLLGSAQTAAPNQ